MNERQQTPSEKYLSELCNRSFLSLWSYPSPGIDKGRSATQRMGKELCDLLVIFENQVIIFSDKSCKMTSSGSLQTDWNRWYRDSIADSAKQIYGAERALKDYPDRIYADRSCTTSLPVTIPSSSNWRVHRIVIALGAGERCASHFGGNSRGSLIIRPSIDGEQHKTTIEGAGPFIVGQPDLKKGFVHIFDDFTLDLVMRELDTITDFVSYLQAKETFCRSGQLYTSHGEEETLAFYLSNSSQEKLGSFDITDESSAENSGSEFLKSQMFIQEGIWDHWENSTQREFQRGLNIASRFFDDMIERISKHALDRKLAYGNDLTVQDHERNIRFMAAEPRLQRSVMATAMFQKIYSSFPGGRTSIIIQSHRSDVMFVFLLFPRQTGQSEKRYRGNRQQMLEMYALVVKLKNPTINFVYGIAMESGNTKTQSEDLMSFDFSNWSDKEDRLARKCQRDFNILTDVIERPILFTEPNTRKIGSEEGNRKERRKARSRKKR